MACLITTRKKKVCQDYQKSTTAFAAVVTGAAAESDQNKNVCTYNGTTRTATAATFNVNAVMLIFAANNGNAYNQNAISAIQQGKLRLYSFKVYDNGTLVRDYTPAKAADGKIGLYDNVGGTFYANAGTGAFTPGEEILYTPETPTELAAVIGGDGTCALTWGAAERANGYKIYRDGTLIATVTDTTYTDTTAIEMYAISGYAVSATNEYGDSDKIAVTVKRTAANPLLYLITDRTQADVDAKNARGTYNATDLNRVSAAVEYLRPYFAEFGYSIGGGTLRDWEANTLPRETAVEEYLQCVRDLDGHFVYAAELIPLPTTMHRLSYVGANNIEKFLLAVPAAFEKMAAAWYYSGELYAGEI